MKENAILYLIASPIILYWKYHAFKYDLQKEMDDYRYNVDRMDVK